MCITCIILERSRTALWRLIHATAKSSSSLNTYPIPDFFGPAAMQLQTFSRARKILGIRILPRAPTLQTYLFWPIGVNHATAKPSSSLNTYPIPDFFGPAAMQRHTFSRARKKKLKFLPTGSFGQCNSSRALDIRLLSMVGAQPSCGSCARQIRA